MGRDAEAMRRWSSVDVSVGLTRPSSDLVSSSTCCNTRELPVAGNDVAPPYHTTPTTHTHTQTH